MTSAATPSLSLASTASCRSCRTKAAASSDSSAVSAHAARSDFLALTCACNSGTSPKPAAERAAPAAGRAGGMRPIAWTARAPPHALACLEPFPRKPTL